MDYRTFAFGAPRRLAGQVELPGELDALRNLLLKGQIVDDEGNAVVVTPEGGFELIPADSPWRIRGSASSEDPSIYVGYQSKPPEFKGRAPEDQPDEVHFYDDLSKNTEEVDAAVSGKVPAETFIYGPGEFAHGEASADSPSKATPAAEDLEESDDATNESVDSDLARILELAGLRRR